MLNDTLKELFHAYKNLPVGVIFFREGELFFVNDHLHSILLLENLSSDEIVRIIGGMIGLETPDHASLCLFLSENSYFTYKNRIFQVNHSHSGNLDIFVLVRINDQTIGVIDQTRSVRVLRDEKKAPLTSSAGNEYDILAKALGKWEEGESFSSQVLYKGIPIKGSCEIEEVQEGFIKIRVEKKQLIAAATGTPWLIGSKKEGMVLGTVSRYDLTSQSVWLENITLSSASFNRRSVIRYSAEEGDQMIVTAEGKKRAFPVHDVSERGVSVIVEDNVSLAAVSVPKMFRAELILGGKKIEVNAAWLYNIAMEETSGVKAAFTIGYTLHEGTFLREWLNKQQLARIKEVRNFVQMLSNES